MASFGSAPTSTSNAPSAFRSPRETERGFESAAKLQELARFDLVAEVRRAIGGTLESGTSLETVAKQLGVPPRRLRTQLTDAGTSFNQVLADYRCRLAKRLLAQTSESIEQIVYLTGFSEPSTFYRAFKRWTGLTPIEYRKKKQA